MVPARGLLPITLVARGRNISAGTHLDQHDRRPAERIMAGAVRWLLSRASPAANTEGTILEPAPSGISTDGEWLMRKNLRPAGEIS